MPRQAKQYRTSSGHLITIHDATEKVLEVGKRGGLQAWAYVPDGDGFVSIPMRLEVWVKSPIPDRTPDHWYRSWESQVKFPSAWEAWEGGDRDAGKGEREYAERMKADPGMSHRDRFWLKYSLGARWEVPDWLSHK